MPIPPLAAMQGPTATGATLATGPLIDLGTVLAVYGSGALTVLQADGRIVSATQSTDEPLRAGQAVWLTVTATTTVVLGSA